MSKKHVKYHVKYPIELNIAFIFIHKDSISNSFFTDTNKYNFYYLKSKNYNCEFILKQYLLC